MAKKSKNYRNAVAKLPEGPIAPLEAAALAKEISNTKLTSLLKFTSVWALTLVKQTSNSAA